MTGLFRRWKIYLLIICMAVGAAIAAGVVARAVPGRAHHYTANGNFDSSNRYLPAVAGFSVADISSVEQLNALPPGVEGLVWVGMCHGVDAAFIAAMRPFIGHPRLFGFYLMDDPDPRVRLDAARLEPSCTASDLRAESDWIHANARNAKTFISLMNMSSSRTPSYTGTYTPGNTHIDLFGISPYPCRSELHGCDYQMIDRYVAAAMKAGIPRGRLVPTYQAFGGGNWTDDGEGHYVLPTAAEEEQILARWRRLVPRPEMDFAYSWGTQRQDVALESTPELQAVFRRHNRQH